MNEILHLEMGYATLEMKNKSRFILCFSLFIVTLQSKFEFYLFYVIMAKKALLMILDGWGIGQHGKGDVIYNTPTPYLDYLTAVSAHSQLQACGENVGLPDGQMGNSEVGHLNIGAGRVVYQDLVKINKACESGDILKNQEIINAYS